MQPPALAPLGLQGFQQESAASGKAHLRLGGGGGAAAALHGKRPPRNSSDSTLHHMPSGRPSSALSNRSSFDSGADTPSERGSFEDRSGGSSAFRHDGPGARPSSATAGQIGGAPQAAGPHGSLMATVGSGSLPDLLGQDQAQQGQQGEPPLMSPIHEAGPSPFMPRSQQRPFPDHQQRQNQQRMTELLSQGEPAGHSVAGLEGDRQPRRRSTGKQPCGHPANLEHGSTAPPGAMDELAELLLAAANRINSNSNATAGDAAGSFAGAAAAAAAAAPQSAAARGAAPRRSAQYAPAGAGEPLLNSQVALLAQQLLLQQQQAVAGGSGGTTAAQLRRSLEQPWQQGQGQGQPLRSSLERSRTVASCDMLRGRPGAPTAAERLLAGSGGSGTGQVHVGTVAARVLQNLDPATQPRFSSPSPEESPVEGSPFSSIQGVYGCHLLPPADPSDVPRTEPSPDLPARSSIDLLLDPAVPPSARTYRHSLDTLSELLVSTPASAGGLGSPVMSVAQLLQQIMGSGNSNNAGSGSMSAGGGAGGARTADGGNSVRAVRHSMDSASAAAARLGSVARTLSTLPGQRRAGRLVDPAASFYGLSSGAIHDMQNSTVTVVAGAVPIPPVSQPMRTSVAAHASSMVDPAAQPIEGTFEAARVGTPEESMLDPDLHDTFGAHPSYGLPAVRPRHRHSSSGGSSGRRPEAAAMLSRANSSNSGSGEPPRRPSVADGWRQPMAAPRRPPLPRTSIDGGGSAGAAAPSALAGQAAGAAAAPRSGAAAAQPAHHPTVYQPHMSPVVSSAFDFSPVGNAVMLEPTTVPGQHSITVHDPQHSIPSLHFLRQCSVARKKLEKLDSSVEAASRGGGGYIAEAKRVLAAAVHTATAQEAAVVESSCSGAIGPLLRYLRDNKHNDAALRSGLHTLSLLVTNSPNRGIIASFHGQAMLCEAMRATRDLELRENIVQLLWDLEAHNKECHLESEDVLTLQAVLEATSNAVIASHILHILCHCLGRDDAPDMSHEQMQLCAQRLVDEIAAHKHHLQDAAQYTLGNLMAVVLGDARVLPAQRQRHVSRLLDELRRTTTPGQCQVVLTVLSCIAGNARVRSAMAHCNARRRLMEFGQHIPDSRLRARSLSLIKILHKQETLENASGGNWYFGGAEGSEVSASDISASPPSR